MAKLQIQPAVSRKNAGFRIEGVIKRDQAESLPGEMNLGAYVFDKAGALLGEAAIDKNGSYAVDVRLSRPSDADLIIGPAKMASQIRMSDAYRKSILAGDWKAIGSNYHVKFDMLLPLAVWRPWWPQRICVSGHVRKVTTKEGKTSVCPVPYVKVEIFDVDREGCFWPPIRKWWELLLDRPVIRIPDILKEPPYPIKPFPGPDPAPEMRPTGSTAAVNTAAAFATRVGIGSKPESPLNTSVSYANLASMVSLNPQPEPPGPVMINQAFTRVGEARLMDSSIASRLDTLTLTSRIAPWMLFPRCFYSKALVCETVTDCSGGFNCCFNWWPFHFRRGRLRFDSRPDIIIRLTQVIDGVSTVIYMDPYTSTRWNVTNAHIDLYLDNEEVVCGNPNCHESRPGSPVFITRVGDDEVYRIDQGTGLYKEPLYLNAAYGGNLLLYAQFGDALANGLPARYYRLSYARNGSSEFTPITSGLSDTRVAKGSLFSETHALGPKTINGVPALYEVRDFSNYYWYNPDWIGAWYTWLAEADTDLYVLRLEVFDENGAKLTSAMGVEYLDGTKGPGAVLTTMIDSCDLKITLDNKPPVATLTIPAVLNECGVIPWSSVPPLNFKVDISQENGRLHSWGLYYNKGVNPVSSYLAGPVTFSTGTPGPISQTVVGDSLLTGLTGTCAFALRLWATAHIRDGRQFIYSDDDMKAIAIEKCKPCPPCPPAV
ncbi:MAG: hypothetical protein HGB00_05465 [Chlorobiaceae bacterium]|nr:hypothetical protein [Chlorobiaceae bacterium]